MAGLIETLYSPAGRIRRRTFWLGVLGVPIVSVAVVVAAVEAVRVTTGLALEDLPKDSPYSAFIGLSGLVLSVSWMWSAICLHVKRWHDRGKSWPHIFIAFIPLIGGIWSLVECGFLDGVHGQNQYGPSPKGINIAARSTI